MLDSTFQAYLAYIDLSLRKISKHLERIASRLDSWNSIDTVHLLFKEIYDDKEKSFYKFWLWWWLWYQR